MPQVVFADTFYWLAMARPRNLWHAATRNWSAQNASTCIVTTTEVLTKYLNGLAKGGPAARAHAVNTVRAIRNDPQVDVLPQTQADFDAALALYDTRPDKSYSLVVCRSMLALQALGIAEILTNDRHFVQEGFAIVFQ
jgi:predicted nucleic acid-binding protein